jgi:hopanoid biosynthesis associated radical SAM protein HpnH
MDGQKEHHDFSVCREGGFDIALEGIRAAVQAGFRVTTNTTLFDGADPNSVRQFFDEMMEVGVESMMVSPGYSYDKAPDQKHFMGRARTRRLFRAMMSNRKKTWRFNQSPLFLEYLMGKRSYNCTPWGMPTYNLFGWQKPCYLLQDGYAESYKELMETTEWDGYGTLSGNPQCANCMVHCGYEPSIPTKMLLLIWTVRRDRFIPTIRWCRSTPRPPRALLSPKKAGHERSRTWARSCTASPFVSSHSASQRHR